MKKTLQLFIFLVLTNFASAQAIQDWTSGLPTLAYYNNHMIASDSQGNVYSVGTYSGASTDFDSGSGVFNMSAFSNNMYIVKVNASGNFVWAKQIGGATTYAITTATSITIDASDNIYISGSTNKIIGIGTLDFDPGTGLVDVVNPTSHYVMYILKLDSNGNHIWNRQFNNPTNTQYDLDKIYALQVDATGNIYATGSFNATVDFDPSAAVYNLTSAVTGTSTDIFILKMNNSGNFVWAKALQNNSGSTSPITDAGYSIGIDLSGNVYSTGYYTFSLDANPDAAIYTLNINPTINGTQYISKLDSNGNFVWAYDMLGQHNQQFLPSIAVDGANNIIVTGDSFSVQSTSRDFDFGSGTYNLPADTGSFVLKIDSNAGFIWAKSTARTIGVSGSSSNFSPGLVLDSLGNIYTTGTFGNNVTADFDPSGSTFLLTSAGNYDAYISKLDTNGNLVWANKLGGTGIEYCYSITLSPSGKIIVSGSTNAGFTKSAVAVSTGGFLASFTQPALVINQFNLNNNFEVYPNPTVNELNLKVSNSLNNGNIKIISLTGQTVFEKNNLSGTDFNFDVSNLSQGIYVLQTSDENTSNKSKFIKQ